MKPFYRSDQAMLYQGDALALLRDLGDESVDGVLTDAPYSSGGQFRGDRMVDPKTKYILGANATAGALQTFAGDNRDQRGYAYWSALWLLEALRVTKVGGICALWTDWRQLPTTTDALQAGGWVWRGIIPWIKPDARPQVGRFTSAAEYIVWGSRGAMPPDREIGCLPGFYEERAPRGRQHLTQKPLDVTRSLCRAVPRGGLIMDPFAGSSTTGVAALLEGRMFLGCEITEHFCAVSAGRLAAVQLEPVDGMLDMISALAPADVEEG